MIREISVQIENEPGRVHVVADALGSAGIDIAALSIADGETTGVLRLIVADLAGARHALMSMDLPATVGDVVAVAAPDRPGGLAAVLAPLQREGVDVRYLYAFRRAGGNEAVVVLHTDRDGEVEALLADAGFSMVREETIHG